MSRALLPPLCACAAALLFTGLACASTPARRAPGLRGSEASATGLRPDRAGSPLSRTRERAAGVALSQLGVPYRYGGSTPRGFDCSGLVVYSYARAGLEGLPHSAEQLERRAEPVPLDDLAPGDLLFFSLSGPKTSHVAIYVGEGSFVHSPSSGGRVERVDFDHVYWSERLDRAGRLVP